MPHSTISQRREAYEAKAGEACELRRQSLERLLSSIEEAREFLGSFQSLQGQFNRAVSRRVPHAVIHLCLILHIFA